MLLERNKQLLSRVKLEKLTDDELRKLVMSSTPQVCTEYNNSGSCDAGYACNRIHICSNHLRTFAPKSSYGEIFFISPLELVHKVLTQKMKKKMGVTDFVSEKMAVEKCLNFDKSIIIMRCSLLC